MPRQHRILIAILIIGWLLRVVFIFTLGIHDVLLTGGDEHWYLANGMMLASGKQVGIVLDVPVDVTVLPTAPLYLLFVGTIANIFPLGIALTIIKLIQTIMGIATCYFAYDIVQRIMRDENAGLVAAGILAFSPALILEPRSILTETSYIFYIVGGLWAYVRAAKPAITWPWLMLSAIFFALATLTRAVALLFPVGLAGLLIVMLMRDNWKQAVLAALLLLGLYGALTSTWTAYNAIVYDRFIIGSAQLMPAIWRGAVEGDASPSVNDELLGDDTYTEQATAVITADPTGYVRRRSTELIKSYLQPHGTIALGNESLRSMAREWVDGGFSLAGLGRLISGEGFWPKLAIYIWHFGGLCFGVMGMVIALRKQWGLSLALIGFIVYTTLLHLVVLALPRYIFPALIIYWMFAAVSIVTIWKWWQSLKAPEAG